MSYEEHNLIYPTHMGPGHPTPLLREKGKIHKLLIAVIGAISCLYSVTVNAKDVEIIKGRSRQCINLTGLGDRLINYGTIKGCKGTNWNWPGVLVEDKKSKGTIKILNKGLIETSDEKSNGIAVHKDGTNIKNEGAISTSSREAHGIKIDGNNNDIVNSGTITTSGNYSHGITVVGKAERNNIVNEGSISTSSREARGIKIDGNNNDIVNSGTITTSGPASDAIGVTGRAVNISNEGSISTSDLDSLAIRVSGPEARVQNFGDIVTKQKNAEGIHVSGEKAVISNEGRINTGGTAIWVAGSEARIRNSGDIVTKQKNVAGIYVLGKKADIYNKGHIATSGTAISVESSEARIRNSGDIVTKQKHAEGIHVSGEKAVISNEGRINTGGTAIWVAGSEARIRNSGDIVTKQKNVAGIYVLGKKADIYNKGHIATSGTAISVESSEARIRNSGDIVTKQKHAEGIHVSGEKAVISNEGRINTGGTAIAMKKGANYLIQNTGEINTTDINANGIFSEGSGGTIDNSGNIFTAADSAQGIRTIGNGNSIVNSGIIETRGKNCAATDPSCNPEAYETENAHGIWVIGNGNSIVNSGIIRTYGQGADGMKVQREDPNATSEAPTKIINNGVIRVSGKGSYGIEASTDYTTILNKGTIQGNGLGGAIHAAGRHATIKLAPGSRTSGKVAFNHPEDSHLYIDSQAMASVEFEGMPPINAISSVSPAAMSGNTFTAIPAQDLLSEAPTMADALAGTVSAAIKAHLDRIRYPMFSRNAQDWHGDAARSLWTMPFNRRLHSDDFRHNLSGMIVGRDHRFDSGRAGGLLGSFSLDRGNIKSVLGGLYLENADNFIDLSLVGGYMNARETSGLRLNVVDSDYLYINPSVGVYKDFALGDSMLTPSISASYFGLLQTGQTEVGKTGLKVNHRSMQEVDIGSQLHLEWASAVRSQKVLHVGSEVGVDAILPIRDSVKVKGNVKSASFSSDGRPIMRGHAGGYIALDLRDDTEFSVGLDVSYGNTHSLSETSYLKLVYSF